MKMKASLIATMLMMAVLLPACGPSQHERFFGHSVKMAIDQQAIERVPPPAEPVTGLDGQYAAAIIEEYRDPVKRRELSKETSETALVIIGGSQ
jgi:hypothetical protein